MIQKILAAILFSVAAFSFIAPKPFRGIVSQRGFFTETGLLASVNLGMAIPDAHEVLGRSN
jgi:hypothetical protein